MVSSGKNVVKTKSSRTGSKRRLSGNLCERLGITYPIFGFSHSVEVTAALAKAGCYPMIGLSQETPEDIPAIVARVRDLVGDRPFGVDLLMPASITDQSDRSSMKANLPEEHKAFIEKLREKYKVPPATKPTLHTTRVRSKQFFADQLEAVSVSRANAFASAIGVSGETMSRMQRAGKLTFSLVGHPKHAQAALDAGVDFIVAQGHDAGGHTGPIGTFSLVPQVVEIAGDTPVIAAGGVGHGRHVAASLAMGAQGAWLGTAWLTAREHALDDIRLRKVLNARSQDTVISRSHSGKTTRQVRTSWSEEWEAPGAPKPLPMPFQQVLTGELLAGVEEHRIEPLIYTFAGQSVAWFNEEKTVAEIVGRIMTETRDALDALAKCT